MHKHSSPQPRHLALHYALAVFCLLFLLWAMWMTARDGLGSFLSRDTPVDAAGLNLLNRAIQLSPSDSRPYKIRAKYLRDSGSFAEAEHNFESAIVRSPHDYLLWLRLGDVREELGDQQGAVDAYQESIRLAPAYTKTHWYLGKLWLRMGKREEGFSELRRSAAQDPGFFPHIIDYAWNEFGSDAASVRRTVQPQSTSQYMTLADSFLAHHKTTEAVELYRAAGELPEFEKRTIITNLLKAKAYSQAYEVWANWRGQSPNSEPIAFTNGDFEASIGQDAIGFEWQTSSNREKVRVGRDKEKPESGAASLRLDFEGNSPSETDIISQILLVQPETNYTLKFAGRTQQLVTGGLPMVTVVDVDNRQPLGQSIRLPENSVAWERFSLRFATLSTTNAVAVVIKREKCASTPCPAFGQAWFDNFVCQKQ